MEYLEKVAAYEDDILYDLAEDEAYDLAYEKTAAAKWKAMMNSGALSQNAKKTLSLATNGAGKFNQANENSLGYSTLNPMKNKAGIRYGGPAETNQAVRAGNFGAMKKAISDRNALNEKSMLGFANRRGALNPFMPKQY